MNRQTWIPALGVLVGVLALAAGKTGTQENGFTLPGYHNADAKFLGEHIITSVGEGIQILDPEGNVVNQYDGLSASWLYVQEGEADRASDCPLIAYSYLAHTLIEGTINNPDPQGENGTYTVKLYRSEDLETWEYVTDIISRKQNVEDGDLRCVNGTLYYFFELEQYDKGPSAICVMRSEDDGETWSGPQELLPAAADNEMASCEPTKDGWRLYVSSDYACVGESYQGASVYYADYTQDFQPVCMYQPSAMPDNRSVRLYEVKEIDGQLHFLFARNFLTDCDLLYRTLEREE